MTRGFKDSSGKFRPTEHGGGGGRVKRTGRGRSSMSGRLPSAGSGADLSSRLTPVKLDSGDEITADEIYLTESNDGELYRQQVEPFIKNYAKKMKNGTYDRDLAIKGLEDNLVPNAVHRYKQENGDIGTVSAQQKRYIAQQWLPSIEEQAKFYNERNPPR